MTWKGVDLTQIDILGHVFINIINANYVAKLFPCRRGSMILRRVEVDVGKVPFGFNYDFNELKLNIYFKTLRYSKI